MEAKKSSIAVQCETKSECEMRDNHFAMYSTIRENLRDDFQNMQGKDLIPFIRSTELLRKRFEEGQQGQQRRLNGSEAVLELLKDEKLAKIMDVLQSKDGKQLVDLYKSSINGQEQNLACSKWRISEIEAAAEKLKSSTLLNEVFSNIHKNFVERSARKCLKTSCRTINENMNNLDSVLRNRRRKTKITLGGSGHRSAAGVAAEFTRQEASTEPGIIDGPARYEQPKGEFHDEELELCRFFKRTNSTNCQISGKELSSIDLSNDSNGTKPEPISAVNNSLENSMAKNEDKNRGRKKLDDLLADYEQSLRQSGTELEGASAAEMISNKCSSIRPVLAYHLFGLRWYTEHKSIQSDKLLSRAMWCPSLNYWIEIDRLCGEIQTALSDRAHSLLSY